MSPELWRRVEELFHAASRLSPDDRPAFLEKACGEDSGLRRHVELLVSKDEHGDSLLEMAIPFGASIFHLMESESCLTASGKTRISF